MHLRYFFLIDSVNCLRVFINFAESITAMGEEDHLFHDEVEIEDFTWDEEEQKYFYPCPCGDL